MSRETSLKTAQAYRSGNQLSAEMLHSGHFQLDKQDQDPKK